VIVRDHKKVSIEALQLATAYVMIAISDQTDLIQTKLRTMNQLKDVYSYVISQLEDQVGLDNDVSDLHHYLLNEDYFIIGTYKAKQWLGSEVFDAIEAIKEYEQSNFGEVSTDFSDPERVANMYAYILGEEILSESEVYQALQNDDEVLDEVDLSNLAEDLKESLKVA
jgi:hypothetical protein